MQPVTRARRSRKIPKKSLMVAETRNDAGPGSKSAADTGVVG